jgi:hypothetical protein
MRRQDIIDLRRAAKVNKNRIVFFVIICVLIYVPVVFSRGTGDITKKGLYGYLAPPRLIQPISDKVTLKENAPLEFQWGANDSAGIDYYDFRLYKGYNTYADNLILKQRVPGDTGSFKAEAKLFENNQAYTWVLKQVSLGGTKSDPSFNSFTVLKEK